MKEMVTPASTSIAIGCATAFILFAAGTSNDNHTAVLSQYLSGLATLAEQGAVAAVVTTATVTTALFYTLIAKPITTIKEKCCCSNDDNDSNAFQDSTTPYNQI